MTGADSAARLTTADITVLVCSRDRPGLLTGALANIAASSPAHTPVLVIDSASQTRATGEVAAAAGVAVVRSDVGGLSIARNVGLAHAATPIVVYTDDDCEPEPGWLDHLVEAFRDPRVGAVTGLLVDHSDTSPRSPAPPARLTRPIEGLDAGHGALMAFRVDVLRRLGGFDEVLGAGRHFAGAEDLDMFSRVLREGHTLVREHRSVIRHVNTREDDAYVRLLRGYGLGLGAMTGKWLRAWPAAGARLAVVVLGRAVKRVLRDLRSPRRRRGQAAMLRGIVGGMASSLRFRVRAGRFVDASPPPSTPLPSASSDGTASP